MLEVLDGVLIRLVNKLMAVIPMERVLMLGGILRESGEMDVLRCFGVLGERRNGCC